MMATNDSPVVNIDSLDIEDQLQWVKEILENGRDRFTDIPLGDDLQKLVSKLTSEKLISTFNKKKLDEVEGESDKVEELHRILKTKGWSNFKKARTLLYDLMPRMKELHVWDEGQVDELPVLSVKYREEGGIDTGVEHDGNEGAAAVDIRDVGEADTDGLLSTRSKAHSQPITQRDFSALPSYNMSNRRHKGICLIINNENYTRARELKKEFKDRRGSSKDAESIKALFGSLGFYVEYQKDLTKQKLDRIIQMIVEFKDLNKYNCFVAIFLSHGENEVLNCVDGSDKKIDDIINCFKGDNCPALNGIPKWFIIQACRGKEFNYEVSTEHDAPGDQNDVERQSEKPISIPACADFYISYATAPGYFSFRNINEGSWFINDLCSVIKEHAHREDVNTMMTRVNRNVALGRCVQSDMGYRRQMPCHVNMLTSALYLHNVRSSQI